MMLFLYLDYVNQGDVRITISRPLTHTFLRNTIERVKGK